MNLQAQRNIPAKNPQTPRTHGPISKEFAIGLEVEKEHGDGDLRLAAKIVADHLRQDQTYYSKLMAAGLVDEPKAQEMAVQRGNHIQSKETSPLSPVPTKIKEPCGNFANTEKKTLPLGADSIEHFVGKICSVCSEKIPSEFILSIEEGGSEIVEPNAGITSDQGKNRWAIDAYPNSSKKITPQLK